jgi:hypothetical protein
MNYTAGPTPITDLWKTARAWFDGALNAFGGPQTILRALDRALRGAIKRRLKALEILAMKLLLVEAAKLTPRPVAPARAAAACSGEKRTAPAIDPARPETWRVSFQLQILPEPPPPDIGPRIRNLGSSRFIRAVVVDAATMANKLARLAALRAAPRGGEAGGRAKAERLARRFEALRRVIANPLPHARRLKRRLLALERHAFAAAQRIAVRAPPKRQVDPLFHERAEYAASCLTPAFFTPDSS